MISRARGLRIKLTLDSQPSGNLGCVAGVTLGRGSVGRRSPLTLRSIAAGSRTGRAAAICISRQMASESMATATPTPPTQYPDRRVIEPCLHARTPPGNRQPEPLESKRMLAGAVPPGLSDVMCRGKASRGSKRARCKGENFAAACQTSVEFIAASGTKWRVRHYHCNRPPITPSPCSAGNLGRSRHYGRLRPCLFRERPTPQRDEEPILSRRVAPASPILGNIHKERK